MPTIIRIMAIRYDTLRSKANIINILHESDNVEKIVLFDKTNTGWVPSFLKENKLQDEKLDVIRTPSEQGIIETVAFWGRTLKPSKDHWVQLLAEDDIFLGLSGDWLLPDDEKVMLLCPISFVYNNHIETKTLTECEQGIDALGLAKIFKFNQVFGDSVWYALTRADIFHYYCSWLAELPILPWHVVNQSVWTALAFGQVGRLPQFLFAKDSQHWQREADLPYTSKNYLAMYGKAELWVWDEKLIWLSNLAHLIWLRKIKGSSYVEYSIFQVIRLINRPLRVSEIFKLLRSKQEFKKLITFLSYSYLYPIRYMNLKEGTNQKLFHFNNRQILTVLKMHFSQLPKEFSIISEFYLRIIREGIL